MISSDRRTVLKGTMALAALGAVPFALRREAPAIFIYDARFGVSRQLAEQWAARGVPLLDPRAYDLGLAWRDHIPRLLASNPRIEGATLWSDRWVCETFGRSHGLGAQVADLALPGSPEGALRQWSVA